MKTFLKSFNSSAISSALKNKIAEKYLAKIDEIKVLKYKLSKAIAEMETIYEEG